MQPSPSSIGTQLEVEPHLVLVALLAEARVAYGGDQCSSCV